MVNLSTELGQAQEQERTIRLDRQAEFQHEVDGHLRAGTLKSKETLVNGIDQAVTTFMGLFDGTHVGKMVAQLAWAGPAPRRRSAAGRCYCCRRSGAASSRRF